MQFASLLLLASLAGTEPTEPAPVEHPLVTIVSEPQKSLEHRIALSVDPTGRIVGLIRRSAVNQTATSADDFMNGRVTLANRESVLLSCPGCDPETGGRVVLEYLSNGITGSYASCAFRLEKADGSFQLTTEDGRPVARLRLTARRLLGVLIGIGSIVVE